MVGLPTGHRDTLSFFSFPPNPFQESSLKTFLGGLEGLSAWLTWPLEVCSVLVSPSPQMHADMMRTYRLKLIWLLAAQLCILIDSHATRSMHTGLFVHLSLFFFHSKYTLSKYIYELATKKQWVLQCSFSTTHCIAHWQTIEFGKGKFPRKAPVRTFF